jgi:hypothetical protein
VSSSTDCDDANKAVNPAATEVCNSVDDNCNGVVDENLRTTYYRDADGDGYGSPTNSTKACSQPSGYVTNNGDCNDGDAAIHPNVAETCDGKDNNCDGSIDEGVLKTFYLDSDKDGYGTSTTTQACSQPSGYASVSGDCNDTSAGVNPGAAEVCGDAQDQNCDGQVDETCTTNGYKFSAVPQCGSYCYYDEPHNIAVNGTGQGGNNNGFNQFAVGQLVDGVKGVDAWPTNLGNGNAYEWVGWVNQNVDVTFRFPGTRTFNSVTIGIDNYDPGDVQEPKQIDISYSDDDLSYGAPVSFKLSDGTLPQIPAGKRADLTLATPGKSGKYVKIRFYYTVWTFIDEVSFK